jgi:CRISPR-associated endonuclease/helicase Cas3
MEDRLVEFDPPVPGPFGVDVQRIALRHHMLHGDVDPDAKPCSIKLVEHGFEFSLGTNVFRYGRYGVKRVKP